ncbi:alpha/beta hydrolase [Actinophytocola sp.]|uniref:alpha/beta fold hydrolase n=1 Tax=Actinophytocola sp. TaxID=1872138 RepID=UPI002ED2EC53
MHLPWATLPSVLLVHGPFAGTSSWAGVLAELGSAGTDVTAVANPLRGLAIDAAYVAAVAGRVDGPVLLVGHGYGGAVITAALAHTDNVVGLVFVAGFALAEGESCLDVCREFPATLLIPALRPATYPGADGHPAVELYLHRDSFRRVTGTDLPEPAAAIATASQRPVAAVAFADTAPAYAGTPPPSWYLVATMDQLVHPDAQRFMARRAGAHTVEVQATHACPTSHPTEVADLIRTAMRATVHRRH